MNGIRLDASAQAKLACDRYAAAQRAKGRHVTDAEKAAYTVTYLEAMADTQSGPSATVYTLPGGESYAPPKQDSRDERADDALYADDDAWDAHMQSFHVLSGRRKEDPSDG